jgi:hypothetical protein
MDMTILKQVPPHFKMLDDEVMSNFDHSIDQKVAEYIKDKEIWAGYSGMHFYGKVWWAENQWHCEVRQYKQHVNTISCETLRAIMSECCSEYGSE